MKCWNPQCVNQLGEGRGYFGIFYDTDITDTTVLKRFVCSPCLLSFTNVGMARPRVFSPRQEIFTVAGRSLAVILANTVTAGTCEYLYAHWHPIGSWVRDEMTGEIRVFTSARAARSYGDRVSVFWPYDFSSRERYKVIHD